MPFAKLDMSFQVLLEKYSGSSESIRMTARSASCDYSNKRDIRVAVMLHISVGELKHALGGNESTTGTYGAVRKVTNVVNRRLTRQIC